MKKVEISKIFPALQYFNIPNCLTTIGLIFSIAASVYIAEGNLRAVMILLSLSASMDLVDGFFAGKLNQQTLFGENLDSLADFFSCVIMPVGLTIVFLGNSIWLLGALSFYCICGMWRLAYYNITESDGHYTGLPVPSAMLLTSISIWIVVNYNLPIWLSALTMVAAGFLMLSFIKLKKYALWHKVLWAAGAAFVIVVLLS